MKKVAVMLDLAFVLYKLWTPLGKRCATALETHEFAKKCALADEDLFRIYCYHCPPYSKSQTHPVTRRPVNFGATPTFKTMSALTEGLEVSENVAFRAGEVSFNGWRIRKRSADDLIKTGRPLVADDFEPDMKQKRVDMKIGLDVAWLSSKSIVDRIILVTGDSDFVPAMKFARREGVQIVLVSLDNPPKVKRDLMVHADFVRHVPYP